MENSHSVKFKPNTDPLHSPHTPHSGDAQSAVPAQAQDPPMFGFVERQIEIRPVDVLSGTQSKAVRS